MQRLSLTLFAAMIRARTERQIRVTDPSRREPIFNAPAVVVVLLGILIAVHAAREWVLPGYVGQETVDRWTFALAFIPARYGSAVTDVPGGPVANVTSFVSHSLVHIDWMHLIINGAWLAAFGSALARRIGTLRFLLLYALSAIAGALLYLAVNGTTLVIMIGASGAVSGLVGAAFRFFFRAVDEARFHPEGLAGAAGQVPRMSYRDMAADPRLRMAVGIWMVTNLVFAMAAPWMGIEGGIAWEAHLGGFLFGLLCFAPFDSRVEPFHAYDTPPDN